MGSLTERQWQIIIGCLLGDGTMRCKTNALLEINHSISQKFYVDWKYRQLQSIVKTAPKKRPGNAGRIAYRFTTLSIPELTKIYKRFYTRNGKNIPENLKISKLSLAIWFMDDGCKSYRAVYFNTQKFCWKNQQRLMKMLKDQHEIESNLNKDKCYWRIRVTVRGVEKLKESIGSLILPQFQYKLPS